MQEGNNRTATKVDPMSVLSDISVCFNGTCSGDARRRQLRAWPDHIDHNRADEAPFRVNDAIAHALDQPSMRSAAMAESTQHAVHLISGMRQSTGHIATASATSLGRKVGAGGQSVSRATQGTEPEQQLATRAASPLWPSASPAPFKVVRYGSMDMLPPKPAQPPQPPAPPRALPRAAARGRHHQASHHDVPQAAQRGASVSQHDAPAALPEPQQAWQHAAPSHDPLQALKAATNGIRAPDKRPAQTAATQAADHGLLGGKPELQQHAPGQPGARSQASDAQVGKQPLWPPGALDADTASGLYSMYNSGLGESVSMHSGAAAAAATSSKDAPPLRHWQHVAAATGFESGVSAQRTQADADHVLSVQDRHLLDSSAAAWSVPFTPLQPGSTSLTMSFVTRSGQQLQTTADVQVTEVPVYSALSPADLAAPLATSDRTATEDNHGLVDTDVTSAGSPFKFKTSWLTWLIPAVAGVLLVVALYVSLQTRRNNIRHMAVNPGNSRAVSLVRPQSRCFHTKSCCLCVHLFRSCLGICAAPDIKLQCTPACYAAACLVMCLPTTV